VSELRAELRDLYDDYASSLDEMDLDAWSGFFTDDCTYRVISFENYSQDLPLALIECRGIGMVRDRVAAIRKTAVYEPRLLRHFVSGVRVDGVEKEVVAARANFLIAENLSDREPQIAMVGRYLDRLVRIGKALRFRERLCVVDNHRIRTSLVVPV
jgi:anthranilate 1,2-dioxygenase small subunit